MKIFLAAKRSREIDRRWMKIHPVVRRLYSFENYYSEPQSLKRVVKYKKEIIKDEGRRPR